MSLFSKTYSLKKSLHILVNSNKWYAKHWKELSRADLKHIEEQLAGLEKAIDEKDRNLADQIAKKVDTFVSPRNKKGIIAFSIELFAALAFALVVAIIIRQTWFEPYEIPSGSMRPTYKEQDHLIVSKTAFGINYPLFAKHFYFDPNQVKRGSIVIWSGENIDLPNTDTTYFWIVPSKRRYVKRLIGKPGDTLYFYGGKVWGIDENGNDLTDLRDNPHLQNLEYLPFANFEGRSAMDGNKVVIKHVNQPVARVSGSPIGKVTGEVFDGKKWKIETPSKQESGINSLSDVWGMGNFAMARLLTPSQVKNITDFDLEQLEEAPMYLELSHSPNLTSPEPKFYRTYRGDVNILLTPKVSMIPLQTKDLNNLMDSMYTARFSIENGEAVPYSMERKTNRQYHPAFTQVPDGRYEFYHGKGYHVGFGGYTTELSKDHPLNSRDPENIQKLYNLGIELSTLFSPNAKDQFAHPSRYAYFRNGDLYVMGSPLLKKDDPALAEFVQQEKEKEQSSQGKYRGFYDRGPPLKEGQIDKEFIKTYGLKVPENSYFVLGDNHAMSADSRYFGFVPEDNLRGSPTVLLWPIGDRWGLPPQESRPWFTISNITVWTIAAVILFICYLYGRRKYHRPIFKKLSP